MIFEDTPRVAAAIFLLGLISAAAAGDKVVVTYRNEITSAELLIALEEGYFDEQGLEVEELPWNGSTEALPLMSQGRIDFSPSAPLSPAHINTITRGGRIRLVAARSVLEANKCGYASFLARNEIIDSGRLDRVAGLRGLRLASNNSISSSYYWARLLGQGGLTRADVDIRIIPAPVMGEALARGMVDVVQTVEPHVHQIASRGQGQVWKPANDVVPDRQNTFLLFGRRLLDERRDLGRRVAAAMWKATRQYVEGGKSSRNVEILARRTGATAEEVRHYCWPQWSADGRIDLRAIEEFQDWAQAEGLIDARVPVSELVDSTFWPGFASTPEAAASRQRD